MSYTIAVRVVNDTDDTITLVEKACWYYTSSCTWTEREGSHLLSMGGSGTSGLLRFQSSNGETFSVVVGVHNYARWCNLDIDLKGDDTGLKILPQYYGSSATQGGVREKQLSNVSKTTSNGRNLTVDYYQKDGHKLLATFTYS